MRLPATSAPLYFLMDPDRKFVAFNQSAYPTLQALSVLNRATETAVIQATGANQPVWSVNAIQGTYSGRNNPSMMVVGTPGINGLTYASSQFFSYDSLSSLLSGTSTAFTACATLQCNASASASTIFGVGSATDGYFIALQYQSGSIKLKEVNISGTFTASATMDNGVHVVTAIKSGGTLTLRVDGAVAASASVTAGAEAFTKFTVGALNSNGTVGSQFTGSMGKLAVYGGSADIYGVETEMLQEAGVIRGPTSGTNSGF